MTAAIGPTSTKTDLMKKIKDPDKDLKQLVKEFKESLTPEELRRLKEELNEG